MSQLDGMEIEPGPLDALALGAFSSPYLDHYCIVETDVVTN